MRELKAKTRTLEDACQHLRALDFVPTTVIDIGVAWGTDELYSAFPDAYFHLVEPIPYFHEVINQRLTNGLRGELHPYALSQAPGVLHVTLRQDDISLAGASIVHPLQEEGTLNYDVEITTLDEILSATRLSGPTLVKIDAQGSDVGIIKGGKKVVSNADVLICEANLFVADSDNLVSSAIAEMKQLGFELYDILDPMYRPRDSALSQVDLVFVKADHPLRSYSGW